MTRAHDEIDKKFGTAIRLARKKHKLTQTQLAGVLGVSFQQIQKYETEEMRWHRRAFPSYVEC
jgi:transcriptional regulator with XRE-family HTH domain